MPNSAQSAPLNLRLRSFFVSTPSARVVCLWALLFTWLSIGMRAAFLTSFTWRGFLDDAAFVVVMTTLFVSFRPIPRLIRIVLQGALALALIALLLADVVHFRFFGFFMTYESILVATQVDEAASSVENMVTPAFVSFGLVLPLLMLATAIKEEWRCYSGRRSALWFLLFVVATILLVTSWTALADLAAPRFNNPVLLMARDAVSRPDAEVLAEELRQDGRRAFGLPAPGYEALNEDYPLLQTPVEPSTMRPTTNVVILLLESVRDTETEVGRGELSVTPEIDAIGRQGLVFRNNYAVGHQTVRGEVAALCSTYTHFGGAPIYVRHPHLSLTCLPEILRDLGYRTHWISSFRRDYFNKEAFLTSHGVQAMHDMRDVPRTGLQLGWGPADEELAAYAVDVLSGSAEPFFAEVMTLSNHDPFNYPYPVAPPEGEANDGPRYVEYLHGVRYTDHAVGRFFELARTRPWFSRTIFVITGDHGGRAFPTSMSSEQDPALEVEMFHRSPLVFFGPGVPNEVRREVSSQVDIAPTILELLGVRAENAFVGRSLLAELDDRFAVYSTANGFHIRSGNRYCSAIAVSCVEGGTPSCSDGQASEPSPYACFEVQGDLLRIKRDEEVITRPLSEAEAAPLRGRLEQVVRLTQYLIKNDAVIPR